MNHPVIACNLRRIRGASGLSQEHVAAAAGLSRGAYRSIERGESVPRVRNVEAIAAALRVRVRDLLEPTTALSHVRFRSHKRLRTRSQILTDVARWLTDYNGLEDLLDCRRAFCLQGLASSRADDANRAVRAAREARTVLGLTASEPVRDICGLLDSAGVKVFPLTVATDGFFGLSVGSADGGPAVVVNTWERISVERWIFSAAHELGHLLLHLDEYGGDAEQEDDVHEREADAFAAEFLMPDEVFWREWTGTRGLSLVERVIKVKRIFRVSYRTVLHRLAPTYQGWATNIWVQFQTEYKQATGRSLTGSDEPDALTDRAFLTAAPEVQRGREPDHLSAGDFREDRLASLVRQAAEAGEISQGRAAEILGLSLSEMRALSKSWVG